MTLESESITEATGLASEIYETAEDENYPTTDEANAFAESVIENTDDIINTINEYGKATSRQINALENMRDGLLKWMQKQGC